MSDTLSTERPTAAPIRTQVRDAVRAAWDAAVADGSLPALPGGTARPDIEVARPADPAHGDFASNLAMKLARPYRMAPMAIASVLAAKLLESRDAGAGRHRRSKRPRRRRPAF